MNGRVLPERTICASLPDPSSRAMPKAKTITLYQPLERSTMRTTFKLAGFAIALAGVSVSAATAQTSPGTIDGRWDASLIRSNGDTIPFRLDISGDGANTKGTFYNGFQSFDSTTSGSYKDGNLTLNVDHYLTSINATLKNGELVGQSCDPESGVDRRLRLQSCATCRGSAAERRTPDRRQLHPSVGDTFRKR